MTVSLLSISARSDTEIAVTFEIRDGEHSQRECFILPTAAVADLGLRVGECDRGHFDAVCRVSELYRARKKGLCILSYGACSEKGLYQKLVTKGVSKETAKQAVTELVSEGYINSNEDAAREAERCVAKLWGIRRIIADLYSKGYSDSAIRYALNALEDDGVDFVEVCAERLRRTHCELPEDASDRRKLFASLSRYGFSGSEIKEAFRILRDEK